MEALSGAPVTARSRTTAAGLLLMAVLAGAANSAARYRDARHGGIGLDHLHARVFVIGATKTKSLAVGTGSLPTITSDLAGTACYARVCGALLLCPG